MSAVNLFEKYFETYPDSQNEVKRFRDLLQKEDCFFRHQFLPGHFTASAFVLSPDVKKILLMHHQKLNKWLQPGGHCDGDTDFVRVARKEAEEETGVSDATLLIPDIFDLDIHEIPENKKEPKHFHYDVRFLFKSPTFELKQNHESRDLAWFSLEDARKLTQEESLFRTFARIEKLLQ